MTGRVGVAISTTGDEHRLDLLEQSAQHWWRALAAHGLPTSIFVTVDGTEADAQRVAERVLGFAVVYRVGQRALDPRHHPDTWYASETGERLGVAVNKNTGLELLMDNTDCEHLFLCDDDTWPLYRQSLDKHIALADEEIHHSMVCWGKHRFIGNRRDPNGFAWATWNWPRGVLLYQSRFAVSMVGGMVEAFGPGGHEHVEYSKRMHRAMMTPDDFCSPASYAERGPSGEATRASALWHCEDMRRPGEGLAALRTRKRSLTSVRREDSDWPHIEAVMARMEGSNAFVDYHAAANGRTSATLCEYIPSSQGAEEPKK